MGIFNDNSQNNNTGGSGQPGQPGLPGQKGDPGIGFKLTADGNFDLDNKQIKNLSGGTDKSDAVNYGQLIEKTNNHQNNYHLQPSFNFYQNFGNRKILKKANSLTTDPHHKHLGLNYVKKQSFNSGFGGQAWVSLKMTNSLPAGVYTVVFETFAATYIVSHNSVTQQKLNSETLLQQVHGDANYTIITFTHDFQTTHSNAIIQFTSNGKPGEITFEIRYYGPSYNNSTLNFLFFSRVIAGRQSTAFNHSIFDVDDVQLANQILYFDDVNLNDNKLKNIANPTEDEDGANKKYVDDEIAKLPHSDNGTLKLDGSRAMTGTLDLGGQRVVNIKPFVEDDSSQAASDAQKYDVVNWGKIHEIRGEIKRDLNAVQYEALNRQSPNPMLDPIDMGNNFITNVKEPGPSNSNYATTVNFVNKTIDDRLKHSVQSADTSNAFQYVMFDPAGQFYDEDDIKGIKKTDKDFHKSNKETYEMQLLLDSRGYYSSRLGVNMYILPNGEYSLVYELYYPNSIDSSTVQISAISAVETVSKVTTNVFNNHTRSIIHLHKYNNVAPNRLMIDMVLKNKAGISYANELTIFVIVYGVSGYVNNVHTSVWDRLFEVTNNSIKFEAAIDMNGHNIDMKNGLIKGLEDGNENNDSVNVKQLNEMESNITNYVKAEIDKSKADVTNNHNLFLILYNYIMKNGTKVGILKDLYFTDSQETKTSNTYLFNFNKHLDSSNRNNFTFYYVFKHNTTSGSGNEMRISMQWGKTRSFIHLFIHVTSSRIIISISPFISPSFISSINIPNNALRKQIWFWIWTQGTTFHLITSGNNTVTHNLRNLGLDADYQFIKFNVDDSPFPKIRGLITSNVYDNNSEVNRKVREFEIAQGTIV